MNAALVSRGLLTNVECTWAAKLDLEAVGGEVRWDGLSFGWNADCQHARQRPTLDIDNKYTEDMCMGHVSLTVHTQ